MVTLFRLLAVAGPTAIWPAVVAAIVIVVLIGCLVFVMLAAFFP